MTTSIALQCLPHVGDDKTVCAIVDRIIAEIAATGLPYFVSPFETTIEGDLDELMALVTRCQRIAIEAGAPSVASYVKIYYYPAGDGLTMAEKTDKYHEKA